MARAVASQDRGGNGLTRLPLFLLIYGMACLSMMAPALHALVVDDHQTAQAFFYAGTLGLVVFMLVAIAHAGRAPRHGALGPLLSLFSTLVFLPIVLAVPFVEALPDTRFINAYFDMVSAITTTGATLFDDPRRLNGTLHLWRAQVGWMGGLLMWVAAVAILAPLNLGGFEVTARAEPGRRAEAPHATQVLSARARLFRALRTLTPIYSGLTLLLWVLLIIVGIAPLPAAVQAMSVLATSGISIGAGLATGATGIVDELLIALFMCFALSRLTFSSDTTTTVQGGLARDPEFRLGVGIILVIPMILMVRQWTGIIASPDAASSGSALSAFWGGLFTVISFLTTTGFVSDHWSDAQIWLDLQTPGMILMALALVGGGVATTAGGVKLLRVYALYRNGMREMEHLVHPHSVSGAGVRGRRLQSGGAFIAWLFFMLFALSFVSVILALTFVGVTFDEALVMAIATLSTTGPLIDVAAETDIDLIGLGDAAKGILCVAMVLGRLETLAIIALLTPDLWRA